MARSIKFSDDTFLDASGVVKGQKNLDTLCGTNIAFQGANIKEFAQNVIKYLVDNQYPFFIGGCNWQGYDNYVTFYANRIAIITSHSSTFIVRYLSASNIIVYKAQTTEQ